MTIKDRIGTTLALISLSLLIGLLLACGESRSEDRRLAQEVYALAGKGEIERVRQLVSADRDLANGRDSSGDLALNHAIRFHHAEMMRFLVESGADLTLTGARGNTPLHEAVDAGEFEMTRLLLLNGADPSFEGGSGEPPLHRLQNDVEIARLLIEHGAGVKQKGVGDNTLLHWCAERGSDDVAALLIELGADPNAKNEIDESPLHLALGFGRAKQVQLLAEAGAKLTVSQKWPALHYAVASGNVDLVEWAVNGGADVNQQDRQGNTGLHVAVSLYGKEKVIEYLVANDARLDLRNQAGQTPLGMARGRNPRASQALERLGGAE